MNKEKAVQSCCQCMCTGLLCFEQIQATKERAEQMERERSEAEVRLHVLVNGCLTFVAFAEASCRS